MAYPELFLKGIPNKDFVDNEGQVTAHLFYFNKKIERDDSYDEESICWKDDDRAMELILNQQKDGCIQFKEGAAIIKRESIDLISKLMQKQGDLTYERKPEYKNPYHGNLLLTKEVKKGVMKKIASAIALACEEIIPQKF